MLRGTGLFAQVSDYMQGLFGVPLFTWQLSQEYRVQGLGVRVGFMVAAGPFKFRFGFSS